MKALYFDNAATTQMTGKVVQSILNYQTYRFANASSLYKLGEMSKEGLDKAREKISSFLGCASEEIIFTSGGTESNNMALKGVLSSGDHVIVSKIEHDSVLKVCSALEKEGVEVSTIGVDKEGFVNMDELSSAFKDNTKLVSVMHANNEIGVIQDIDAIGKVCHEKGVLFHTDAVQSFCKVKIPLENVDFVSISAHKIHGPKGVGALYVKKGVKIKALIEGGGHEFGLRSGTENVPSIVGFGEAVKDMKIAVVKLRDKIIESVLKIEGSWLNGSKGKRLPNNAHFGFKNIEGEALVLKLDENGIMTSTGSACSSKSLEPSHVLIALGLNKADAHGSLRITLSEYTKEEDVDRLLETLPKCVEELRSSRAK
tara:strand:- start:3567 stop:4676 length:1110 start_codon:yes stop_codon:yes gene_type:complete